MPSQVSQALLDIFADPKIDFVFQRLFGAEEHKPILIDMLNAFLGLEGDRRIVDLALLPPEQRPKIPELKLSIVDVKCVDARGTHYVVEMQVLYVEAFEKRVVYNVAKAYTNQLGVGLPYPELDDVVGISICNFVLWPDDGDTRIPMLSRWRMREERSGAHGLDHLRLVFLELPKLDTTREPRTLVEKWAYFFREAAKLESVPPPLATEPAIVEAFEVTRLAKFTKAEWDTYTAQLIAIQDEVGIETGALRRGREQGLREGLEQGRTEALRVGIETLCDALGVELSPDRRATLARLPADELTTLLAQIRDHRRWP